MQYLNELFEALQSKQKFVITCHVNPDADAIGSELALAELLNQMGKSYKIINSSSTPYNLMFMDTKNSIEKYDRKKHDEYILNCDASIFLDLNQLNRTARMAEAFERSKATKICIDHHKDPDNFADLNIIDESKSSTGELIYDLIKNRQELELNFEIAFAIYSAIMTDTGSFRFSKTTADLHLKVSELLRFGLNTEEIYDKVYAQYEFGRIKLLGKALNSISLSHSGKVSYLIVTQSDLKNTGGIESDVDGFVNFALTSKGVEIGILFFELNDGLKISFRSKGEIPVNELASQFGGGGHLNASGTRLFNIKLKDLLPKVLSAAEDMVKKYNNGRDKK